MNIGDTVDMDYQAEITPEEVPTQKQLAEAINRFDLQTFELGQYLDFKVDGNSQEDSLLLASLKNVTPLTWRRAHLEHRMTVGQVEKINDEGLDLREVLECIEKTDATVTEARNGLKAMPYPVYRVLRETLDQAETLAAVKQMPQLLTVRVARIYVQLRKKYDRTIVASLVELLGIDSSARQQQRLVANLLDAKVTKADIQRAKRSLSTETFEAYLTLRDRAARDSVTLSHDHAVVLAKLSPSQRNGYFRLYRKGVTVNQIIARLTTA